MRTVGICDPRRFDGEDKFKLSTFIAECTINFGVNREDFLGQNTAMPCVVSR